MHRFNFVLYRPIQLIPVLIGISIVTFVLIHAIPGDPARLLLGAKATPENLAVIRRLAQNILRLHPSPKSISRKMRAPMWSKDFFFELFTHMR
jgi:ABC-type dipeptide/oligopeptide/nickel transport system permease component